MAAVNSRDLALQATVPRIEVYTLPPEVIPGLPEVIEATKGIKLTAPSNVFQKSAAGVYSPADITITAELVAVTGTITWATTDGVLTGSGNSRTIAGSSIVGSSAKVTASVVVGADTYTKDWTIVVSPSGPPGGAGPAGNTGTSNHRVYRADSSIPATPGNTVSGAAPAGWSLSPVSVSTGQTQYQSDGVTPAGSTTTTWGTPYPSYFKVGELSAITVNTGSLTINDYLTMSSNGLIRGGKTSYADSTPGFFLGWDSSAYKFVVGNSSNYLRWTGSALELLGNLTGVSNIDITGSAYFAGNSTAGGFNAVMHIVNAAGASMGLRVTGNGGEGIFASTNKTDGVGAAVRGLANSFAVGVKGEATSSGVAVRADNSGGVALDVIGSMRWNSYNYAAPDGVSSTLFMCKDGTWRTAGGAFTAVQQGGGAGQLSNKVYIGWLGSGLGLQIDSSNFANTWPIGISGFSEETYKFGGMTYSTFVAAITSATNTAINDAVATRVGLNVYYNIEIVGIGTYTGRIY